MRDRDAGKWKDPMEEAGAPKVLTKPFDFYGAHVALSEQQKEEFAERELVNYYKCVIAD